MAAQTLRSYQSEAVDAVLGALKEGYNRVLYTAATGLGKTTTFAELVSRFLQTDDRVLVLAHRKELVTQAYERLSEHCGLDEWEIGIELAQWRAHSRCKVVVGSIQSVMREGRPRDWTPTVIITDEAHRAAAKSYANTYKRFGVYDGKCVHIGCTATAKRTDRLSLYAQNVDGSQVWLEDKRKGRRPAVAEESVFERHVFDYGVLAGVEAGWLVPIHGHTVQTDTDINQVQTDTDGDFKEGQLARAVDNETRTLLAISAWKQLAEDRPTLVFCASVEHAHNAAELWRQAGYKAAALDGETDSFTRGDTLKRFQLGELDVLCNMGLFTEGVDVPRCACIVHLRPTKSWNLYVQMTGRGTRALPGLLDDLQEAPDEDRVQAIAESGKPNCYVIDLVDLYEKCGDLCSVPSILDLPVKLDLQGHSVTEAKKLLDQFEEVKDQVIGECPKTYSELAVRLEAVNLMRNSTARSKQDWKATDLGYRFTRVPPGYRCDLLQEDDSFRLLVIGRSGTLLDKAGKPGHDMQAYLDCAARRAQKAIEEHTRSQPLPSRGTLERLTSKQVAVLWHAGYSREAVDCMPYAKARAIIKKRIEAYRAQSVA